MKQTNDRYRVRRPALDGDQLVLLVVIAGLAWSCWSFMQPPPPLSTVQAAGDAAALEITSPPLRAGTIHYLETPEIGTWWAMGEYEHHVRGRVAKPGPNLQLRPWLYTTAWLPQPVVKVEPDGTFDAVVYFSPQYDAPLVLALEIENRDRKLVTAKVNFFFRAAAGAKR